MSVTLNLTDGNAVSKSNDSLMKIYSFNLIKFSSGLIFVSNQMGQGKYVQTKVLKMILSRMLEY